MVDVVVVEGVVVVVTMVVVVGVGGGGGGPHATAPMSAKAATAGHLSERARLFNRSWFIRIPLRSPLRPTDGPAMRGNLSCSTWCVKGHSPRCGPSRSGTIDPCGAGGLRSENESPRR